MKKTRIMWVEDDHYRLRGLVRPLEQQGIEVVFVDNMRSALELLDAGGKFDLFLIDLIIPEGVTDERPLKEYPGLDLIKTVRERFGVSVPIIAFTVVANEGTARQVRKYNGEVLRKGVCIPSELCNKILSALKA